MFHIHCLKAHNLKYILIFQRFFKLWGIHNLKTKKFQLVGGHNLKIC